MKKLLERDSQISADVPRLLTGHGWIQCSCGAAIAVCPCTKPGDAVKTLLLVDRGCVACRMEDANARCGTPFAAAARA